MSHPQWLFHSFKDCALPPSLLFQSLVLFFWGHPTQSAYKSYPGVISGLFSPNCSHRGLQPVSPSSPPECQGNGNLQSCFLRASRSSYPEWESLHWIQASEWSWKAEGWETSRRWPWRSSRTLVVTSSLCIPLSTEGKHSRNHPVSALRLYLVCTCGWLLFSTQLCDLTVPEGRTSDTVLQIRWDKVVV